MTETIGLVILYGVMEGWHVIVGLVFCASCLWLANKLDPPL